MMVRLRPWAVVVAVTVTSVLVTVSAAVLSLTLVLGLKRVVALLVQTLTFLCELTVALVAAGAIGWTLALIIVTSVIAARMTLPASSIRARIGVTITITACAVILSGLALIIMTAMQIDYDVAVSLISAAAGAVAFASAWAVGVMSLIEKETQQVGLKMQSLFDVVRHNNHWMLRLLLKLQAEVKQRDLDLGLVHAVRAGYYKCAEILLVTGADANTRDCFDNTCLMLSSENGCTDLVKILLKHGADVHARNQARATALHLAAKWGHSGSIHALLEHKGNVNVQDAQWRTPLMLAAETARKPEDVIAMLLKAGGDVNVTGPFGKTAIHFAVTRGCCVQILLDAGADIATADSQGNTPIHCACAQGNGKVMKMLISSGADVTVSNLQYRNCVHLASMNGSQECVMRAIEHGACPFHEDFLGHLPLWYAVSNKHLSVTGSLLQINGHCAINDKSNRGTKSPSRPIDEALENGNVDILRMFTLAGLHIPLIIGWLVDASRWGLTERECHVIDDLRVYTQSPVTLAHLCRLVLRDVLGVKLKKSATCLPLPTRLISFIMLDDIFFPTIL